MSEIRDLPERLQHRAATLGHDRFEAGREDAEYRSAEEMRRKPRKRQIRRLPEEAPKGYVSSSKEMRLGQQPCEKFTPQMDEFGENRHSCYGP